MTSVNEDLSAADCREWYFGIHILCGSTAGPAKCFSVLLSLSACLHYCVDRKAMARASPASTDQCIQGAYNQQEGPLPTSHKPLPTNLAIKLLLHNAQALFSPVAAATSHPCVMGRPLVRGPMCSCWKQAQPAVATPGVP